MGTRNEHDVRLNWENLHDEVGNVGCFTIGKLYYLRKGGRSGLSEKLSVHLEHWTCEVLGG